MLIGITGKKGSGKTTIAAYLDMFFKFRHYAFADPLKGALSAMFGLPPNHFHDEKLKETVHDFWGLTPREMMTRLGTDFVREHVDKNFWIRRMQLEFEKIPNEPEFVTTGHRLGTAFDHTTRLTTFDTLGPSSQIGHTYLDEGHLWLVTGDRNSAVIADVRFENECQWVRDRGGHIIHVVRPNPFGDGGYSVGDEHPSESGVAVPSGDIVVENDGNLSDLYQSVRTCVSVFARRESEAP